MASPNRATSAPVALGILPLRNHVVFPGTRTSFEVMRAPSMALLESLRARYSIEQQPMVVLVVQKDATTEAYPSASELPRIGVTARITSGHIDPDGKCFVGVEALTRVRITRVQGEVPFLSAEVEPLAEARSLTPAGQALFASVRMRALQLLAGLSPEGRAILESADDATRAADLVAANLHAAPEAKVSLLEAETIEARLRILDALLAREDARQRGMREAQARVSPELLQLCAFEPGAAERIGRAVAAGRMTGAEARSLVDFTEKGYVIWERLVSDTDVDALVADVARIGEHPGSFVTTDHRRARPFRFSGPDFDGFESVFDTYVNLESARRVCFHPTILRFLELLFESRPMAFQQLLFQRSNEHALHQDTAYVCVDDPLTIVATWVALEDVVQGRGELTYFEGSHRIPGIRFADGSKRFSEGVDDEEAMHAELDAQLRAHRCQKRDFLAKKGDVFLWAADLVHGSNPRTRPKEETRLSCVTHYCPETVTPLSFLMFPEHAARQPYGDRALIASSHYVLPSTGAFARPTHGHPLPA